METFIGGRMVKGTIYIHFDNSNRAECELWPALFEDSSGLFSGPESSEP